MKKLAVRCRSLSLLTTAAHRFAVRQADLGWMVRRSTVCGRRDRSLSFSSPLDEKSERLFPLCSGMHIETALAGVPVEDRCKCKAVRMKCRQSRRPERRSLCGLVLNRMLLLVAGWSRLTSEVSDSHRESSAEGSSWDLCAWFPRRWAQDQETKCNSIAGTDAALADIVAAL